jgi:hypothetical protein
MTLWNDWGMGSGTSGDSGAGDDVGKRLEKENRWRRSWILAQSRRAVRRWVQEREGVVATS